MGLDFTNYITITKQVIQLIHIVLGGTENHLEIPIESDARAHSIPIKKSYCWKK